MSDRRQTTDTDYVALELLYNAFMEPAVAAAIASFLPAGGTAKGAPGLDVGCGPGGVLQLLHTAASQDEMVGIDLSFPHLQAARQRVAAQDMHHRVRLVAADMRAPLPFRDAMFGWAWAADVLWPDIVQEPDRVVRELKRIVQPGGVVAIFFGNWLRATFMPGHPRLEHFLCAATEVNCFRRRIAPASHYENALGWLRTAGLEGLRLASFLAQYQSPLDATVRRYIEEVIFHEYRRPEVERCAKQLGMTNADWDDWMWLSDPASPRYLLDQPDYHCLQVGELMTGIVPAPAASTLLGATLGAAMLPVSLGQFKLA